MGDYWTEAVDWLGSVMDFVFGAGKSTGVIELKEALAAYRGKGCGVPFAEAVKSFQHYPVDIL
jgi:hypothetical protein